MERAPIMSQKEEQPYIQQEKEDAIEFNKLAIRMIQETKDVLNECHHLQKEVNQSLQQTLTDLRKSQGLEDVPSLKDSLSALGHLASFISVVVDVTTLLPEEYVNGILEKLHRIQHHFSENLTSLSRVVEAEDILMITNILQNEIYSTVNEFFPIFEELNQIMQVIYSHLTNELKLREEGKL